MEVSCVYEYPSKYSLQEMKDLVHFVTDVIPALRVVWAGNKSDTKDRGGHAHSCCRRQAQAHSAGSFGPTARQSGYTQHPTQGSDEVHRRHQGYRLSLQPFVSHRAQRNPSAQSHKSLVRTRQNHMVFKHFSKCVGP